MNVTPTIDAAAWLGKYLEGADGDQDLARAMLAAFAEALMSAQASMQCNAAYGERCPTSGRMRNSQDPWMRFLTDYAATSSSCSSDRSAITPFSNFTPARTRATRWGALTIRHRV